MSVGFIPSTPGTPIFEEFLDTKPHRSSWTLIARARNTSTSPVTYQFTVTAGGKTCTAGPTLLHGGVTGTKNCKIQPEYSATGRYTLTATVNNASDLEWKYLICQN
jgi:hypothetical protein